MLSTSLSYAYAGDNPTQNMSEMVEDFMPAFFQIMIVMIFVLLLLVMVDRIAHRM